MDKNLSIPPVARDQIVALLSSLLLPPAQGANVQQAIAFLSALKPADPEPAPSAEAEKAVE